MSTISVPLPEDMLRAVKNLVKQGVEPNTSELVRKALKKYLEDQAVEQVLRAQEEPNLEGNLDDLAKKL